MKTRNGIGRIGIWSAELRYGEPAAIRKAAAELDELGFGAIWLAGGLDGAMLADVSGLLAVTHRAVIATGILSVWKITPEAVAAWWRDEELRDRVLLGLGVSHDVLVGEQYGKPLGRMRDFLDGLDAQGVPAGSRCLAALGPKMQALAAERSAGAHPFLVTPEHTAAARRRMGPDALLAPEQAVILEENPSTARELARAAIDIYLGLPNYINSWRLLGFTDEDFRQPERRLLDALFVWGPMDRIVERVGAHLDAGADHVCLQVIHGAPGDLSLPRAQWRDLASALTIKAPA